MRRARPYRTEKSIRKYVAKMGGEYYASFDWPIMDDIRGYWAWRTPKNHLRTEIFPGDGRVHVCSIPKLKPDRRNEAEPAKPVINGEYESARVTSIPHFNNRKRKAARV